MAEKSSWLAGPEFKRKSKFFEIEYVLLIVAVFISGACIVWLLHVNSLLRRALNKSPESLWGPQSIQIGDIVPPLNTVNTTGRPVNLMFSDSKKSLVIIFSSACGVCANEIPVWNRIAVKARSKKYVVRGISIDSLEDTQREYSSKKIEFDILIMPNKAALRAYRVVSVPAIMIISDQSTVEWFHYGGMGLNDLGPVLTKMENDQDQ